jgi:4-amino-4-deoxy-L-arabinose transferase-like glycosyltransferase
VKRRLVVAGFAAACSCLYLASVEQVPFHPDESLWIHMSADFDSLAHMDVQRLVWLHGRPLTEEIALRLMNAPLAKYVIGAGRHVSGHGDNRTANWDWALSWDENQRAGALPSPEVLRAARAASASTVVVSLAMMLWLASRIWGLWAGAIGTLLLATHPLMLVHGSRAMAEGPLQLFTIAALFAIARLAALADWSANRRRWRQSAIVAGVGVGLAVAAKQSAVALVPVAAAAAGLSAIAEVRPAADRRRVAWELGGIALAATLVSYVVVNPVLYARPLRGGLLSVSMRAALVRNQVNASATSQPRTVMPTVGSRLLASWREVYWARPAFSESSTYDDRIAAAGASFGQHAVVRVWNHRLTRSLFLGFSAFGLLWSLREAHSSWIRRSNRVQLIVVFWLASEVLFVVLAIPLDWQRYFVPILPPVCLLAGVGAVEAGRRLAEWGPRPWRQRTRITLI